MKIKLMVGDMVYTEFELADDAPTSPNMAMTMVTKAGQTMMMEWEQFKEDGKDKMYTLTYAFTVKPEHLTSLTNLLKKGEESADGN